MGNSTQVVALKTAIVEDDEEAVRNFIENAQMRPTLERRLNRKGDNAVIFCARQGRLKLLQMLVGAGCDIGAVNHEEENALDVSLQQLLPDDGNILQHHYCPYEEQRSEHPFHFTDLIRYLLRLGLTGKALNRLVLFCMNNPDVIKELIELIPDMSVVDYRIGGLLLQVTVWYEQSVNLLTLLESGAVVDDFWRATFMPKIRPNQFPRYTPWPQDDDEGGEYEVTLPPDSDAIQNLKLSFIQDWRADWNDGENPSAQFRAGLQITPAAAVNFIRAFSSRWVISQIIADINNYLPMLCNGPDLRSYQIIEYLLTADYAFTQEERLHVELKFGVQFKEYEEYMNSLKCLRHLCRAVIRRNCQHNVFYAMKRIENVPKPLQDYITISVPLR